MKERICEEIELIKQHYPDVETGESQGIVWLRIPKYKLPSNGWNLAETAVALNFPTGFPGSAPYGLYFQTGLAYNNQPAGGGCQFKPPFDGDWNMISWTVDDGAWKPGVDVVKGTNMLSFLRSFYKRLNEGL